MLIASTVKEVEGDFFCRSSHRSLFVLVCVILFRWNEEVKVSHLWVFITCQRNVSRHWRSHEMKSCLLQTTNWGEEEKNWDTLSSLQNITNTHFLFCPDHYSFRLTWRYKTLLNHTTSWGDVQFLATILVFFQSFLTTHLEWSFVKIRFLSCPGAIKRMQNAFSMHPKMLFYLALSFLGKKIHHFRMHWVGILHSGLGFFNTIFKSHNFSSFKIYNDLRVCCYDKIHNFLSDSYTVEINESFQIEIRNPLKCRVVLFKVWMRKIQGPQTYTKKCEMWQFFLILYSSLALRPPPTYLWNFFSAVSGICFDEFREVSDLRLW